MDYSNVEEKVVSLFEPDMLLSAQYMENLRRKTPIEPEKKLMLAVLEDAINCFQANAMAERGRRKRLFDETLDWFLHRGDDWLFRLRASARFYGSIPTMCAGGCYGGRTKSSRDRLRTQVERK